MNQVNEMINKLEKLYSDFSENYKLFRKGFDEIYPLQDSLLELLSKEEAIDMDETVEINIIPIDVPEIDISIHPSMRRLGERNEKIIEAIKKRGKKK